MTHNFTESYDIVVIGAGHAGVEASLAASRMGCKVLLATLNIEMLAFMRAEIGRASCRERV